MILEQNGVQSNAVEVFITRVAVIGCANIKSSGGADQDQVSSDVTVQHAENSTTMK